MDLRLYLRVLWRFRLIVVAGALVAVALAFLSFVRVSFDGSSPKFSYRGAEQWSAQTTLFVTQRGFPWGSTVQQYTEGTQKKPAVPLADPSRMTGLAFLYSQLAESDAVRALVMNNGPVDGTITATVPTDPNTGASTPLVAITATGATAEAATSLAKRVSIAFRQYIADQQRLGGIPSEERVVVQDIKAAGGAMLVSGRKKTVPAVIFLTVMIAVFGIVFVLENLRPQVGLRPSTSLRQRTGRSARSARRTA